MKCWLYILKEFLCKYEFSKKMWIAWWTTNNFRIDIKRMLNKNSNADGALKLAQTRWEDEIIVKLKELYEEEWLLRVRGDSKTRCVYEMSEESRSMLKDDNIRDIHKNKFHKLRIYELFKTTLIRYGKIFEKR